MREKEGGSQARGEVCSFHRMLPLNTAPMRHLKRERERERERGEERRVKR